MLAAPLMFSADIRGAAPAKNSWTDELAAILLNTGRAASVLRPCCVRAVSVLRPCCVRAVSVLAVILLHTDLLVVVAYRVTDAVMSRRSSPCPPA